MGQFCYYTSWPFAAISGRPGLFSRIIGLFAAALGRHRATNYYYCCYYYCHYAQPPSICPDETNNVLGQKCKNVRTDVMVAEI